MMFYETLWIFVLLTRRKENIFLKLNCKWLLITEHTCIKNKPTDTIVIILLSFSKKFFGVCHMLQVLSETSLITQAMRHKPELSSAPCPQTHLDAVNKKSHQHYYYYTRYSNNKFLVKKYFYRMLDLWYVCSSSVLLANNDSDLKASFEESTTTFLSSREGTQ